MLTPTDYGRKIAALRELNVRGLEQIFNELLIERLKYVMSLAPENLREFLQAYSRRFEVRNLLRILRGKTSGATSQEVRTWLAPLQGLSRIDFEALSEAENLETAVALLKGTPYEKLKERLDSCSQYGSVLPLEYALKAAYYNQLLTHVRRLPRSARSSVQDLIGAEVDITNCFISLASVVYGYSKELVRSLLIPFSHKVPVPKFEKVVEAKTSHEALSILGAYAQVVEHILNRRDSFAEAQALKILRMKAALTMRESFIELPYVVSYLILCELECRDLTYVALGLETGLDPRGHLTY